MGDKWVDRIIITGGNGFLGRHVVAEVSKRVHNIKNIVVPSSKDWNLISEWQTNELFRLVKPDIVIHLAARVGGISANDSHPADFFADNMKMGMNIIEACHRHNVGKLVLIGTVCSFPKFCPIPFSEDNFWNGYPEETNASYGIAKKALFEMAGAYHRQYGMNIIRLIPTNLYGPGKDNYDLHTSHVIPALIRKFVEAKEQNLPSVKCWGSGTVSREFLYVKDCAEAIAEATEKYNDIELVNIGSGREMNISALAIYIAQTVGYKGKLEWDVARPSGQPRRRLNTERAERYFGWTAKTSFEVGIRKTIDWYMDNREVASET